MSLTKQELIEEIASWAGGLHIAVEQMTAEALAEEVRQTVQEMTIVVQEESDTAIWISGMELPRRRP